MKFQRIAPACEGLALKQILQNLSNGTTEIAEVPCPAAQSGEVLIASRLSLLSAGTERSLVEFGKAGIVQKARMQPDKVRMVLDKVRTDGLATTLAAVRTRLDAPLVLGYCNVGVVAAAGPEVTGFAAGERVVSNGPHAEMVCVPKNLCAKVPDAVPDEAAVFTVVGAIGLQGMRLAQPALGEAFAVIGLGLIGLVTVQLLRANGCRVLGIDLDPARLALARQFGAEIVDRSRGEDPLAAAESFTRGLGMDGVLITASTSSNEPIVHAARMCRKRGRIVLVGVTGLELSRADFYHKELSFQVSCSYGPGRYDPNYEEKGVDYPPGFVRWTEQRNFEAVLDMMAAGKLDLAPLISHRFPIEQAASAYEVLSGDRSALGILLEYSAPPEQRDTRRVVLKEGVRKESAPTVGFIGAGNYAGRVLIPAFKGTNVRLRALVSYGGVSAVHYGRKFGFEETGTSAESVLEDGQINAVVIATRHDSHASLVSAALRAGKHVFVEKPLCLSMEELEDIQAAYEAVSDRNVLLMVGFNRRFAPHVQTIKGLLNRVSEPKSFIMTVNAGAIPADHWTQDLGVGGGRIVGEACHFIDLLRHLTGAEIARWQVQAIGKGTGVRDDKATITLSFADGSFGAIHYLANGHRAFPKERLEIFCAGRVLQLNNFRKLAAWGWPAFWKPKLWQQDKGHAACAAAFVDAVRQGAAPPIPVDQIFEVTRVSLEVAEAARA